jgi:hypothetical protein
MPSRDPRAAVSDLSDDCETDPRVDVHYAYLASIQPSPVQKERLMKRAGALYLAGPPEAR